MTNLHNYASFFSDLQIGNRELLDLAPCMGGASIQSPPNVKRTLVYVETDEGRIELVDVSGHMLIIVKLVYAEGSSVGYFEKDGRSYYNSVLAALKTASADYQFAGILSAEFVNLVDNSTQALPWKTKYEKLITNQLEKLRAAVNKLSTSDRCVSFIFFVLQFFL